MDLFWSMAIGSIARSRGLVTYMCMYRCWIKGILLYIFAT